MNFNMHVVYAHANPRECLELKLLGFYYDIFERELGSSWNTESLKNCLEQLKRAYSKQAISNSSSRISFDRPEVKCCYIFHYVPCFSSLIAQQFRNMLYFHPWLFQKLLVADTINICCIGGGPATEFVAVAKCLEQMMWRYYPRSERPLQLNATVIDVNAGWGDTVRKIKKCLKYFVDKSLVKYELNFVQADLTRSIPEEVKMILRNANIITMAKFMTAVYGISGREGILCAMQQIVHHIQEDGILLFIDTSGFPHYDVLQLIDVHPDFFQMYGLWEHDDYQMSPFFVNECNRLYFRYFGPSKACCTRSKNVVRAWLRRR